MLAYSDGAPPGHHAPCDRRFFSDMAPGADGQISSFIQTEYVLGRAPTGFVSRTAANPDERSGSRNWAGFGAIDDSGAELNAIPRASCILHQRKMNIFGRTAHRKYASGTAENAYGGTAGTRLFLTTVRSLVEPRAGADDIRPVVSCSDAQKDCPVLLFVRNSAAAPR